MPGTGTILVGQQVTEPVTLTNADGSTQAGTARYQEPIATGAGQTPQSSCGAGTTKGTAVATWADGATDVIDYTTQSAAAAVQLTGTVVPSIVMQLVPGTESVAGATAPSTYTVSTDSTALPAGNTVQGVLAFEVTNPTQCTTAAGVTSAGISGVVGVGSTS